MIYLLIGEGPGQRTGCVYGGPRAEDPRCGQGFLSQVLRGETGQPRKCSQREKERSLDRYGLHLVIDCGHSLAILKSLRWETI